MKPLHWIVLGVGAAYATYLVINNLQPKYATGTDEIENASHKTAFWGTKQRTSGTAGRIVGKVKEGLGRVTGNDNLADEGAVDQAKGAVKDAVGNVAQAAGQTIHDLNF